MADEGERLADEIGTAMADEYFDRLADPVLDDGPKTILRKTPAADASTHAASTARNTSPPADHLFERRAMHVEQPSAATHAGVHLFERASYVGDPMHARAVETTRPTPFYTASEQRGALAHPQPEPTYKADEQ
jgi:hypothetical protein